MTDAKDAASPLDCFVVMPFGRDPAQKRWFKGWYEVVIKPAVIDAGYRPVLAASEEQPGAINDEIRSHLALDPMVVVDLGGADPDQDANPNVMYELGIRHALGLPLVMMAWEGQRLPFDVSNQRVIMEPRDFLSQESTKKKLVSFIKAAQEGRYYKPMEAVGRFATIEAASATLSEDNIMGALVKEIKQLRGTVASATHLKYPQFAPLSRPHVKLLLRGKPVRKELHAHYLANGGSEKDWAKLLKGEVSGQFFSEAQNWTPEDWKAYFGQKAKESLAQSALNQPAHKMQGAQGEGHEVTDELVEQVRLALPPQPWPTGIHRVICDQLGISRKTYNDVVQVLVKRGAVKLQIDGVLYEPTNEN